MDLGSDAQYWFGHGLTYTTYRYSRCKSARHRRKSRQASLTLTTPAAQRGRSRPTLYPANVMSRRRPARTGTARLSACAAQARRKQIVSFPLTDKVLGYFDLAGKWRTDPGNYQIWIAPNPIPAPRQLDLSSVAPNHLTQSKA